MTNSPTQKCSSCGGPLGSKSESVRVRRGRDGFVGTYCGKQACQEAGFAAAQGLDGDGKA